MVVIIKTKDGYWIAADGVRSGKGQEIAQVCKIHVSKYGLVVKAGASQGFRATGDDYSTDTTVRELLETNSDAESFMERIKQQFLNDLTEELVYTSHDQAVTPDNLPKHLFTNPVSETFVFNTRRDLLFLNLQDGSVPIRYLAIIGSSNFHPITNIGPGYEYISQTKFDWSDIGALVLSNRERKNPPGVHMFVHWVDYRKSPKWIEAHPDQAALEMLQQGHSDDPNFIGPPYTLVHVRFSVHNGGPQEGSFYGRGKITWIKRGKCPGWAESIIPDLTKNEY